MRKPPAAERRGTQSRGPCSDHPRKQTNSPEPRNPGLCSLLMHPLHSGLCTPPPTSTTIIRAITACDPNRDGPSMLGLGVSARGNGASARGNGVSARGDGASARGNRASALGDGASALVDGASSWVDGVSSCADGALSSMVGPPRWEGTPTSLVATLSPCGPAPHRATILALGVRQGRARHPCTPAPPWGGTARECHEQSRATAVVTRCTADVSSPQRGDGL